MLSAIGCSGRANHRQVRVVCQPVKTNAARLGDPGCQTRREFEPLEKIRAFPRVRDGQLLKADVDNGDDPDCDERPGLDWL
jgi:hypothetical protein